MAQDTLERPKRAKNNAERRADADNGLSQAPWTDIRDCVAAGIAMSKVPQINAS